MPGRKSFREILEDGQKDPVLMGGVGEGRLCGVALGPYGGPQ